MDDKTQRELTRLGDAAREDALRYLYMGWGGIVQKFVEEATEKGSVQHAKFLVEWAGFEPKSEKETNVAETKSVKAVEKEQKKGAENKDEEEPCLTQVLLDTLLELKRGEWTPAHLEIEPQ